MALDKKNTGDNLEASEWNEVVDKIDGGNEPITTSAATIKDLTIDQVVFVSTGGRLKSDASLKWDNSNKKLTVSGDLDVTGTMTTLADASIEDQTFVVNKGGSTANADDTAGFFVEGDGAVNIGALLFDDDATTKWKVGAPGSEVEVLDLSSTQTLTNKTIDANNNTLSNLAHGAEVDNPSSGVHGVTGNVVGTNDTQTLENKTLTQAQHQTSATLLQATANYTLNWNDPGSARTITIPDPGSNDDFVFAAATQTLTSKTIDTANNTLTVNSADVSDFDEAVDDRASALLQAGTDLSWTYDDAGNTLTIDITGLSQFSTSDLSEGTNLYYTAERARDDVGAALVGGTNLTKTVDDAGDTITFDVDDAFVLNAGDTITGALTFDTAAGTNVAVDETGIDRSSASAETFNIQNSGAGGMTLQQDGTAVVLETRTLTGGDGVASIGDLSQNRTVAVDLVTSGGLKFTTGQLEADEANIDHDALSNFVANEHIDHSSVNLSAGTGLTGGGDITASRSFDVVGGAGITANADDIVVDQAFSPTWTGSHDFSGGTLVLPTSGTAATAEGSITWDATADELTVGDGTSSVAISFVQADYVTMSTSGSLDSERVLTAGTNLSLTDGGAGGNATLDVDDAFVLNTGDTITGALTFDTAAGVNAVVDESGIDRVDAGTTTFNVQNSGSGDITLQQDGTAVVLETRTLTGGDGVNAIGDLSANRTVSLDLATGGGLKFTTGQLAIEPADFAGTGLEDDGSDNLRLATQGTGIAGGAGSLLSVDQAFSPTWTGSHTFDADLTLSQPSQNFDIGGRGGALTLQSQSAASTMNVEFYTADGDGTDDLSFAIFALGTPSNITDRERFRFIYDSANLQYHLRSSAAGTGSVHPIHLFTGSNTNQIIARTDGNVTMSGGLTVDSDLALKSGTSNTVTLSHAATAGRTLTLPDATDTLVGLATTDTLTNKTIDGGTLSGTTTYTNAGAGADPTLSSNDAGQLLTVTGNLNVSGAITEAGNAVPNATDTLDFFSATTSAELASVISDETGSGLLVFGTGPTLGGTITITNAGAGTDPTFASNDAAQVLDLTGTLDVSSDVNVTGTMDAGTITEGGVAVPNANDTLDFFSATTSAQLAGTISDETGSGSLVFGSSPTLGGTITITNSGAGADPTITSNDAAQTLTVTGTLDATALTEGGTAVPNTSDHLGVFAATTSAQLAGVISDETGSGALVFGTSPSISDPTVTGTLAAEAVSASHTFHDNSGGAAGTYSVASTDFLITVDASGGAVTVDSFDATAETGRILVVKKVDSSANVVTLDPTSTQTVDGSTTHDIEVEDESVTLMSDGNNWLIV